MAGKINLAIFTASNLRTSTGSNNTVLNLLGSLDPLAYRISLVLIDDLVPPELRIAEEYLKKDPSYIPFSQVKEHANLFHVYELSALTINHLKSLFDFAIVAIYNNFGEDGRLIGFLETAGIPYLSPGLKTSALCFDKELTKKVLKASGISVPKGFEIHKKDYDVAAVNARIERELSYPVIIKATSSGASRGATLVREMGDLSSGTDKAFHFSDECIVEEYIKGREFSVGVLGNYLDPKPLPVVEIVSHNEFFDYEAKYVKGKAEEICPAEIDEALRVRLQDAAVNSYQAVKAENQVRVDMILFNDVISVLEVNTFPGLTFASIFPRELLVSGTSLSAFLDRIIRSRLHRAV